MSDGLGKIKPESNNKPFEANKQNFLSRLGNYKDGVTVALALIFFVVGFYQYFENKANQRISMALNILERRENSIFVKARTTTIQKWFEVTGALKKEFVATTTYTPELLNSIAESIGDDLNYRAALLNISTFYSNATACVLDGLCDRPTICLSLAGEVQDYLNLNKYYFVYLRKLRDEDSLAFYAGLDVFENQCNSNISLNIFSRMDQSFKCKASLQLYRITGIDLKGYCTGSETKYATEIIAASKKLITK